MGLSKLDDLYRQMILDYSSHSHHRGSLTGSANKIELNDPTYEDVTKLQVDAKDGIIKNIAFNGSSCSISTASASMITNAVVEKPIEEAEHLAVNFLRLVRGKEVKGPDQLDDTAMLGGVARSSARTKCAALVWKVLGKATENDGTAAFHHYHREEE